MKNAVNSVKYNWYLNIITISAFTCFINPHKTKKKRRRRSPSAVYQYSKGVGWKYKKTLLANHDVCLPSSFLVEKLDQHPNFMSNSIQTST